MLHLNFQPFPELRTERLVLRQLRLTDAGEIFTLRNNADVNRFIDRQTSTTMEEAVKFIKKINLGIVSNRSVYWCITKKENDILIGTVCLWNISEKECKAEIGYELLPDWQRKGIMQEVLKQVIDYAFERMMVKYIEAYTHEDNVKSARLLVRNQFKRTDFRSPENGKDVKYILEKQENKSLL